MAEHSSRDPVIDAVRGLALFGILIANLPFFSMPGGIAGEWWRTNFSGIPDIAAVFITRTFCENKFILIFSFLFGYGAARQLERGSNNWFRWRLLGLGLIGILHALLLWPGDILLAYALMGLILSVTVRWPLYKLLKAALLFWAVAIAGNTLVGAALVIVHPLQPDAAAALALYQSGNFTDILRVRLAEWGEFYGFGLFVLMPLIAAAFLLGAAAHRWLAGQPPSTLAPFAFRVSDFILWPAIIGGIAYGVLATAPKTWASGALVAPEIILRALFSPLMAFVIFAGVLRLFTTPQASRLIRPFAANGRLSLSVYIAQSAVCVLLFHGYGLGLYGQIGPATALFVSIAIFAVMTLIGEAWLRVFGKGPLEKLIALFTGPRRPAEAVLAASTFEGKASP